MSDLFEKTQALDPCLTWERIIMCAGTLHTFGFLSDEALESVCRDLYAQMVDEANRKEPTCADLLNEYITTQEALKKNEVS